MNRSKTSIAYLEMEAAAIVCVGPDADGGKEVREIDGVTIYLHHPRGCRKLTLDRFRDASGRSVLDHLHEMGAEILAAIEQQHSTPEVA